jgi:hypothetical protein
MRARSATCCCALPFPTRFGSVDLYIDNVFDEVAIGRVLSSPLGFDLTLSSPPRDGRHRSRHAVVNVTALSILLIRQGLSVACSGAVTPARA